MCRREKCLRGPGGEEMEDGFGQTLYACMELTNNRLINKNRSQIFPNGLDIKLLTYF